MKSQVHKSEAEKIYKAFLITAKYWISELDYYGPNQFKEKINDSEWTIGQLYNHLIYNTYNFHLRQIEHCLLHVHGAEKGKKNIRGRFLFFLKRFPFWKIKGERGLETIPDQPENPVKAKDEFYKFMKVVQKTAKRLESATMDYKTPHPDFGMLNALEWLRLLEMHFRHHIRQKKRLDVTLRSTYKAVSGEEIFTEV
jgi:hypothetical protein